MRRLKFCFAFIIWSEDEDFVVREETIDLDKEEKEYIDLPEKEEKINNE